MGILETGELAPTVFRRASYPDTPRPHNSNWCFLMTRPARREAAVCAIIAILATVLIGGCDDFFVIDAHVTDCDTGEPIAGARATTKLDRGFDEEDHIDTTRSNGRLEVFLNEPPSAWATVYLESEGYHGWAQQFRGAPTGVVSICLRRAVAEAPVQGSSLPVKP